MDGIEVIRSVLPVLEVEDGTAEAVPHLSHGSMER